MTQKSNNDPDWGTGEPIRFLNEHLLAQLETAEANPFVRLSTPDKSIPFIVTADGGVIADIKANSIKAITEHLQSVMPAANLHGGAGFIDVFHGNKLLVFRHVESTIFAKKWLVDDIASALQHELNLFYPGYQIRSR